MTIELGKSPDQPHGQAEQRSCLSLEAVEKIREILTTPREGTISQFELEPHLVQIDKKTFRSLNPEDKAMLAHAAGYGTPIPFINSHQKLLDTNQEEVKIAGKWGRQYLLDRNRDTL